MWYFTTDFTTWREVRGRYGKTHLAIAMGYGAAQEEHSVLFADAISVINDLPEARPTQAHW